MNSGKQEANLVTWENLQAAKFRSLRNFAGCENSHPAKIAKFLKLRNFASCEIFAILQISTASLFLLFYAPLSLHFLLFFPSSLRSATLSLTRILCAWIDYTISAQIGCKNYKN